MAVVEASHGRLRYDKVNIITLPCVHDCSIDTKHTLRRGNTSRTNSHAFSRVVDKTSKFIAHWTTVHGSTAQKLQQQKTRVQTALQLNKARQATHSVYQHKSKPLSSSTEQSRSFSPSWQGQVNPPTHAQSKANFSAPIQPTMRTAHHIQGPDLYRSSELGPPNMD